jgi:hypothetical protein
VVIAHRPTPVTPVRRVCEPDAPSPRPVGCDCRSIRDEYDDLVWPLLGRLQRGESLVQIVEWIEV